MKMCRLNFTTICNLLCMQVHLISLKVAFDLLHEIAFLSSLILPSFLYFDVFMCTHTCDVHGRANTTCELCVQKYLRVRATDSWVSPSYISIYTYMCISIYTGAIKVQVNRGGGLHGSVTSKFCGSYVVSENAHYTIPKPKPRERRPSSSFLFTENTSFANFRLQVIYINTYRYH